MGRENWFFVKNCQGNEIRDVKTDEIEKRNASRILFGRPDGEKIIWKN